MALAKELWVTMSATHKKSLFEGKLRFASIALHNSKVMLEES